MKYNPVQEYRDQYKINKYTDVFLPKRTKALYLLNVRTVSSNALQ
jgi:retron-type reverse transcriptase